MAEFAFTLSYLVWNTWTDVRNGEVNLRITLVYTVGLLLLWPLHILTPQWTGILPGLCLWLLSRHPSAGIGSGDGPVIMAAGLGWGIEKTIEILTAGFLLAGGVGIIWIIRGKKKETLPFLPFLLSGYLVYSVCAAL